MEQPDHSGYRRTALKKLGLCVAVILFLSSVSFISTAADRASEMVAFNVKTYKVHKLSCTWAQRCTKNCITIKRGDAYKRGGVACKVCGG